MSKPEILGKSKDEEWEYILVDESHPLEEEGYEYEIPDDDELVYYHKDNNSTGGTKGRRLILSTNVAETSLTVPGIRYVIDTGVARISRYSYRTKIQRLPIEAISQSSANQRKGRCGRVEKGICFRMYSEEDFQRRTEFTEPEILRTNLASVILQMELLNLGTLNDFPFIDRPDSRLVNDGYKLLFELKAVDEKRRLTPLGKQIAKMPIDPKLARMIIEAKKENALKEVLVIVSALSVQDPRERPVDKMQAADQKHAEYRHEQSDFLTWVTLWDAFEEQRQLLSGNQLKKYCNKQFLAYMRMREWRDMHRQLHLLVKDLRFKENTEPAGYTQVHKSLLSGLLGGIARKEEKRIYMGGRNRLLNVFPSSSLYKKSPNWMMSAEIVETSKIFARMNAAIEPEWIENLADHLVKKHWSEPHWEKKQGQVVSLERVTLYGLDIVSNRKVSFSRIDPSLCREIFIRQALVEGSFTTKAPFWSQNNTAMAEVHELEAKVRRRDILVDDEMLFAFYDEHLPKEVLSSRHFESWWRKASPEALESVRLTKEKLMARQDANINEINYPDAIETRGLRLPLQYHFEPGQKHDGVTLKVPVSALKQVSPSQLEWVVPGLIREKCIQLIKRLPRHIRKHFVPVPDFVDKMLPSLKAEDNTLLTESIAKALLKKTGIRIASDVWNTHELDDYLQFNIQVVDASGKILAESRDLNALQEQFGDVKWSGVKAFDETILESEPFTEWGDREFKEEVRIKQAGVEMKLYPALKDEGDCVTLIHCNDAVTAQVIHSKGVARLFLLRLAPLLKNLDRQLTEFKRAALLYAPLGKSDQLWDDLLMSVAHICFLESKSLPRNFTDFNARYDEYRAHFIATCEEQAHRLFLIMETHNKIMKRLKGKMLLALAMPMADLKFQLSQLVKPGFLADTPVDWLKCMPRYLQACEIRLDKMGANLALESQVVPQFKQAWENFETETKALLKRGEENPELTLYRWMIEEWRVSLYAQQLGTKMTVSEKRLEKQWAKVKGLK